jgi:Na+/H+-dicarboxylate symporter
MNTVPHEEATAGAVRRHPLLRLSLSAQVLIGLALGVLAGLFFGELIVPIQVVGDIFIGLLQMTVLPYILVSLIAGIGKLSYPEVKLLALRGGRFVLLFWGLGLAAIVAFASAFPGWESATFFSSSLVETPPPTDLVALYIPANPFFSLSNSVVPAIVLFSLAIGLAVIGVPNKGGFIADLDVVGAAIMSIAGFVARLAPIGVFALIAPAAGTLDTEALGRLQVYILTYIGAALLLSLWVLPGLVSVLTPIPARRLMSTCQDALVTAFATGSLLIVLPLIVERIKELLAEYEISSQESDSAVDLLVPINFNLPNLGKLLSLAFVPFAAWFAGSALGTGQYPLFLFSGLLSFFGEVVVALPFLLDLMRIPADMFQLFLAVDVFTGRFGTLLAGTHTIVLALLTAVAVSGRTRLHWPSLARYALISVVAAALLFGGLRFYFDVLAPQDYREYEKLVQMNLLVDRVRVHEASTGPAPSLSSDVDSRLALIRQRERLRVGYPSDSLPYIYRNEEGTYIGLEVDMMHMLARELDVGLEFVRIPRDEIGRQLDSGRVDLVIGGLLLTPRRALEARYTEPYLNATLSLIVPDHRRTEFDTNEELRALDGARIAALELPYYTRFLARNLPKVEVVPIDSPRDFFRAEPGEFDALLYSAQAGSAWTLVYPQFSVVVPKPRTVSAPVALALPRHADDLYAFVDTWLELQAQADILDELENYWIRGEGARATEPRWSVIRDVLGWVE